MKQSLPWKIDDSRLEVILDFNRIAEKINLPYLLVGAVARDLVDNSLGIPSSRLTNDVDLAIHINGWDNFEELSKLMLGSGKFRQDKSPKHRFFHKSTDMPVDIIPFGPIDGPNHTIYWPDPDHTEMSTLGFEEVYQNALEIKISTDPDIIIKISSRPGLAIMKLIAWNDNRSGCAKDALDILHVIRNYLDANNQHRLYKEHSDLIEADNFDYECAGARLLGRDIASIASPEVLELLESILKAQTSDDSDFTLIRDMMTNIGESEYRFNQVLEFLKYLRAGLEDIKK
jgi:predicted nucleotidyltransferase